MRLQRTTRPLVPDTTARTSGTAGGGGGCAADYPGVLRDRLVHRGRLEDGLHLTALVATVPIFHRGLWVPDALEQSRLLFSEQERDFHALSWGDLNECPRPRGAKIDVNQVIIESWLTAIRKTLRNVDAVQVIQEPQYRGRLVDQIDLQQDRPALLLRRSLSEGDQTDRRPVSPHRQLPGERGGRRYYCDNNSDSCDDPPSAECA